MSDLDDEVAAAAAEVESEFEEDEGPEEEEDETSPQVSSSAKTEPAPAQSKPRNRNRLRRRRREEPRPPIGVAGVRPALTGAQEVRDKNVAVIWSKVVGDARAENREAGEMYIAVRRHAVGPNRTAMTAFQDLSPIPGSAVAGNEQLSPGEDLVNYVTDVYHLAAPIGPAKYLFQFYWRNKQATGSHVRAPEGELVLGDPKEIRQQREAMDMVARRKSMEMPSAFGGFPGVGVGSYPQPYPQAPRYAQPQAPQPPPAPLPPPPPAPLEGASAELLAMQRQLYEDRARLERTAGVYEERARMEGVLASRPLPAPVPVESPAEVEARIAASVVKALIASGIVMPPAPAAAVAPPLQAATVATAISDPLAVMKQFIAQTREFRKMEREMTELYTPEEEEEPPIAKAAAAEEAKPEVDPYALKEIVPASIGTALGFGGAVQHGPRREGETMPEYIMRIAMANPGMAAKVGNSLQHGALGQLAQRLLSQTAMGQAMAARAGGGPMLGAAPGAGPALGSNPPPPPSLNGKPVGFNPAG